MSRIGQHEARLLEEVEMRRLTEYKKVGLNPDDPVLAANSKVQRTTRSEILCNACNYEKLSFFWQKQHWG